MWTFQSHVLPLADVIADRQLALAEQVADVERQAEVRVVHLAVQLGELVHRVDEHARLRLERQPNARALRRSR